MLKLAKTALLSGALIALTSHSASAAGLGRLPECERNGGHTVNGKCEMPAQQTAPQAAAPAPAQQAAPPAAAPAQQQQDAGRGARGQQGGTAQVAPPQGAVQQGEAQRNGARGGAQPGAVQQGNVQQDAGRGARGQQGGTAQVGPPQGGVPLGDVQRNAQQGFGQRGDRQGAVQQGNDRNNNFAPRDNGQYGNGQYGNNQNQNFGQRNNNQYGNGSQYGSYNQYGNNGRNFDQNEFNRRYYGRYGNDPNNFQRNRQLYRTQQRWRAPYPHDYVYADDPFYRDCRSNNEVGGAIVGAILGGLLGNSVSQGQGGATLAGLILGGVGGAALARNLDCEDRADVYRTYYDGFERGRPRASYQWRNDRTGHYGTLLVGDYYRDPDNYRCATYTQTIYVRGTPQAARGHACRQDDGTWAIID